MDPMGRAPNDPRLRPSSASPESHEHCDGSRRYPDLPNRPASGTDRDAVRPEVLARTAITATTLGAASPQEYGAGMARVVLPGEAPSRRRRARALEPTRAAKPVKLRRAADPHSTCSLCGSAVTPDGDGHDRECWGLD